jgi:hypothetical protein
MVDKADITAVSGKPDMGVYRKQPHLTTGSPEWRLLVLTACLEMDESKYGRLDTLLREPIDWDLLIYHGTAHGTIGLLYRHLMKLQKQGGAARAAPEVIERLRRIYLVTAASGMQQIARFRTVAEELGRAGVKIIVLKGAVLAESLYGDFGLRPLSDVDVLVREQDWPTICEVLKAQGYKAREDEFEPLPPKLTRYDVQAHMQYYSPVGTCLELQVDLLTLGIGMRDIESVWSRSGEAVVGGVPVSVLSPEDQLLHLAVHANRHGCMRLKWLVDIAETLRQSSDLDWDLVIDIAQRERIVTSVYSTIMHTERLLCNSLVRSDIIEMLRPKSYQRALWNAVWPRKQLDGFNGRNEHAICFYFYRPLSGWNIINFAVMGRVRDKLAYQARWLVPSLTWMSQTYNQPKRLKLVRYYAVRMREGRSKRKRVG